MRAIFAAPALVLGLALAGCTRGADTPPPARTEPPEVAVADTSAPADPADAVRKYYAAIEAKDFARAYAFWGQGGLASGRTYAEFAAGFDSTAHTAVAITDPVTIEGAAGSSFAEVRVRVDATTLAGEPQRFAGAYVVRRVNDVPGATPGQLRWHLDAARLDPVP
jgi:hypothetical protein